MKTFHRVLAVAFLFIATLIHAAGTVASADPVSPVAFLSDKPYAESVKEVRAAYDFLSRAVPDVAFLTFGEILKKPEILTQFRVAWYHKPEPGPFPEAAVKEKLIRHLRAWLNNGHSLLLTLDAMKYLVPLGLESVSPADSLKSSADEGYGRKLGFHAFLDHPLFEGMNGGAYVLCPMTDTSVRICGYFGDQIPRSGKVVAVDWDYIFLRDRSKVVLEYETGSGRVIAAGAYTVFSAGNSNRRHLELFLQNALRYLSGQVCGVPVHFWDYSPLSVSVCNDLPAGKDTVPVIFPESKIWMLPDDPLILEKRFASADFFDIAGERILVMGKENAGIDEIWAHPFMAIRDYDVGIRFDYRDTVYWLKDERPRVETRPESFIRIYRFPRAYLKEVIVTDPVHPCGIIHYEYSGVYGARIVIRFRSNLRLMWPYPETATGSISYGENKAFGAIVMKNRSGENCVFIGGNREPDQMLAGQYSDFVYQKEKNVFTGIPGETFQAAGLLSYSLDMTDRLDIVFTAGSEGIKTTQEAYSSALKDPYGIWRNARTHVDDLLNKSLTIVSPDPDFNRGYQWALIASDRFFVRTPGMGSSLVAGYATTKRGWDGGQKVSGRPGYAWYFGRDGQWSGMALLDYGDFEKVRTILGFYRKYQDLSGKIFHEATTSGVIHYDAADATPLYIILAGKYFRHTGDTGFLRENWTAIKKALDFCFSTDTDQDHLIENTNAGHGWVEGGELYGSHATLYLQGCWAAALEEAGIMAAAIHPEETGRYQMENELVIQSINRDFWDPATGFFSYGMNRNGSFRHEKTVLPAVPMYFHIPDREKASIILTEYAGNAFSTNWGVRIVREDSPLFNPRGYHYGSVWPLFTGWTALAEYRYGNYIQGFSHIMNNLDVYRNWGRGFVEEVLNGAEYLPSGVCPHQCWSETMVLQPAIEGMLGLEINAPGNALTIAPHFPAGWDSVKVRNIRVVDRYFDLEMKRIPGKYRYSITPQTPGEVSLTFFPSFPAGTQFGNMTANGKTMPFTSFRDQKNSAVLASMKIDGRTDLELDYSDGISVLPVISSPNPGDPSSGLRIISSRLVPGNYTVTVEGVPGTSGEIEVYLNGQIPESITGGRETGSNGNILGIAVDFEQGPEKYIQKTLRIVLKK
jgi:hypothetical protein